MSKLPKALEIRRIREY